MQTHEKVRYVNQELARMEASKLLSESLPNKINETTARYLEAYSSCVRENGEVTQCKGVLLPLMERLEECKRLERTAEDQLYACINTQHKAEIDAPDFRARIQSCISEYENSVYEQLDRALD